MVKKRGRLLSPSAIFSSFLSLPSPIKTLHNAPLAEMEGMGVIEARAKRRHRRRRQKSTTKGARRWDVKESNDLDTLPPFHSSLHYYLAPHLLQRLLSHFIFSIVVLVLTLVLAVLLILRIAYDSHDAALEAVAVCILAFFALEILLRLLAYGRSFYRHPWFLLSSLLTLLSFLFVTDAFGISILVNNTIALILQSLYSLLRFLSITFTLTSSARRMVSTNKTRYTAHGFDLDLTYITPRVIAMGLPSTSLEGLYRNPIDEVARFFNTLHPRHFLIVNCCSERRYDSEPFEGRVLSFPFDDHNPPPLSTAVEFCTTVDRFLAEDDSNVVAVHCKGGKGRTGTMIACWLLYASMGMTTEGMEGQGEGRPGEGSLFAEEAMKVFARSRTEKGVGGKVQGVSGPSQKRYVHYFEQLRWRMIKEEEEEQARTRRRNKSQDTQTQYRLEERKEVDDSPATVSPISSTSSHSSFTYTLASPKPLRPSPDAVEEKERVDAPAPPRPLSVSASSTSPAPSPPTSPQTRRRRLGLQRRSEFLSSASRWLYDSPKCEVLSLVLNNAVVSKESEVLMSGDERSRDEWNETWNHRDNWSLVITHYRPIIPRSHEVGDEEDDEDFSRHPALGHAVTKEREEEKREGEVEQTVTAASHRQGQGRHSPHSHLIDIVPTATLPSSSSSSPLPRPATSTTSSSSPRSRPLKRLRHLLRDLNSYNQHRYDDVHEYYFKARPKESGDDDTSVTFDISSFEENSKSLILSGDLKFQIYRGKVDVGEDEGEDLTSTGGRREGGGGPLHDRATDDAIIPPQRKISRALANPLAKETPRLFAWFWVNTAFLPQTVGSGGGVGGGPLAPPPSELILRKNQLDEAFQASDIDSEFNVYLFYFSPPLHKHHMQIEELHRGQMMRIRHMEEERKRREREERRRKEGKSKDLAKDAAAGKKTKGGAAELELIEVNPSTASGVSASSAGGFGELKEDDSAYEPSSSPPTSDRKLQQHGRSRDGDGDDSSPASGERADRAGERSPEGSEDTDEEEDEVEEEEREVEAEAGQADFAA